jgi:hypothetical protein
VTALFRHPLGLPIPHTAIIPTNKDRIGDSLAAFLKDNFLTPAVMARRMEGFDVAGGLARWLTTPSASGPTGRLRRALAGLVARFVVERADDEVVGSPTGATKRSSSARSSPDSTCSTPTKPTSTPRSPNDRANGFRHGSMKRSPGASSTRSGRGCWRCPTRQRSMRAATGRR